MRSTQRDAGFLRSALPISGNLRKPALNPFQPAGTYTPEEERNIVLNGIATLPDREGYLWLKTLTDKAIRIRTPFIDLGTQRHFRMIVDSMLYDTTIGGRITRNEYIQGIKERDREWMEALQSDKTQDLDMNMAHGFTPVKETA